MKGSRVGQVASRTEGMEPPVVRVGNARREPKAQQVAKPEDVVRDAAAVGVVDGDIDIAAVK